MNKSLKSKAIKIHNKDYVQVKDRIIYFNDTYANGCIKTKIISDGDKVVIKAFVYPIADEKNRYFTGISASNPAKAIEKQSPHEVAETSAVGRALAMMGIGVIDSVASVDEINKSTYPTKVIDTRENAPSAVKMATMPQVKKINTMLSLKGINRDKFKELNKLESLNQLTFKKAHDIIEKLEQVH